MRYFPHCGAQVSEPGVFTSKLEVVDSASSPAFLLTGYLDGCEVARAQGDFHPNGAFRLISIKVNDQAQRGKGLGSAMIRQLIDEANRKSCNELVFIGVADTNRGAIDLYTRFGAWARQLEHSRHRKDYVRPLPEAKPDVDTCLEYEAFAVA